MEKKSISADFSTGHKVWRKPSGLFTYSELVVFIYETSQKFSSGFLGRECN